MNTCLIVWFSWRYDKNLKKLEEIYSKRFSKRYYLVPFYDKEYDRVIPVFETSLHFQGYFAQAYQSLPKEDIDYYCICADDMILNPLLNESNIIQKLKLGERAYIKYLNSVSEHSFVWHKMSECLNFLKKYCAIPFYNYVPSCSEAVKIFEKYGLKTRNLGLHNLFGAYHKKLTRERFIAACRFIASKDRRHFVEYPLAEGYSDFLIIPKKYFKKFCFYCGIFAAMNLWHDTALATALVFACDEIAQEKDVDWFGTELWSTKDVDSLFERYDGKLDKIMLSFQKNQIYIHPIKLSRWS